MTWVKLDDQFPEHPKVLEAGPMAAWLNVCGMAYCARLLTDGFIPAAQVRKLADVKGAAALAERLVTVGLWERADGGYQVHDYLAYQSSRGAVLSERQQARDRMNRVRQQRTPNKRDGSPNVRANISGSSPNPTPTPIPTPESVDVNPGQQKPTVVPRGEVAPPGGGPPRKRKPMAERRETEVDEPFRERMRAEWGPLLGDTVDERINLALAHRAARNYTDRQLYVHGWLRRDAEMVKARGPTPPNARNGQQRHEVNGHGPGQRSAAKRDDVPWNDLAAVRAAAERWGSPPIAPE